MKLKFSIWISRFPPKINWKRNNIIALWICLNWPINTATLVFKNQENVHCFNRYFPWICLVSHPLKYITDYLLKITKYFSFSMFFRTMYWSTERPPFDFSRAREWREKKNTPSSSADSRFSSHGRKRRREGLGSVV